MGGKTHKTFINLGSEETEQPAIVDQQSTNENRNKIDTLDEKICKAEILWSIATAEHDISFLTNDHVTKLT